MQTAPIALFVYNRLWHTQQTIDSLKNNELASQSNLFVFSDGAKAPMDEQNVTGVRKYLRSIEGFKSVTIIERDENYGLARSIITGVTDIVNRFGRIIVLEDDLITAPFFLRYMNDTLESYQNEDQVMQVSGYMFDVELNVNTDAIFLSFVTSWGWGTWQRAWHSFDGNLTGYKKLENDRLLRRRFNLDSNYHYFDILKKQAAGKVDSWAIAWYLFVFLRDGLVCYPTRSMVHNNGFDGSGTHCGDMGSKKYRFVDGYDKSRLPHSAEESPARHAVYRAINRANRFTLAMKFNKLMKIFFG